MVNKILIIIFIFSSLLIFSDANIVSAYNFKDDSGLKTAAGGAGYTTDNTATVNSKISIVVKSVLSFLGVIFLILMIYGGFLWMTAAGNEQQIEKAKTLLTAAIIGLIVVISAYAISYFIVDKLSGEALKQ